MRIYAIAAMLLLMGAAPAPEPRWEPIFDGKSLDGWTPKITGRALGEDPLHMFIVQDGAIRVSHAQYKHFDGEFGHLFWKAPLGAYRIRFEYRLFGTSLPGIKSWQATNSGLMFHAQPPETIRRDQDFPVSLEMQLLATPRPTEEPSGNVCTPGTTVLFEGKRDPRHCILASGSPLPAGRWTRAELEVLPSGDVTHYIDGKAVLRYSAIELDPEDADAKPLIAAAGGALQLTRGYIALQGEGHPIEFRNIELQRLD
ncbi:3-keto-disaccharide hydrolase [Sphingobium limneticum]|uniref:DUF1080 domain-containing protein n=1 Tax=Sphingobium limneticum TaxID=1007511 RepID=A0A5J5HZD2_9SPHN|nr:DUF1080 domain-containing protein [Sphingobium limneticum]KAA9014995.1 DUF1080 domain-containing protein [Sphingobium limneticum]KAA9027919.1 DUF1080 domain-containing protein [Sphingobium limneticum]